MTKRSTSHDTFRIERLYDAAPARVWRAISDPAAKAKWFRGPPDVYTTTEQSMDLRVGGRERLAGRFDSGMTTAYDATFHDIVEGERLVYAYTMHLDGTQISVSLGTMEITPEGGRTRLVYTEQGVFLDGLDTAAQRQEGTEQLLDALGRSLSEA